MNFRILQQIDAEYESAKERYPWWPADPIHAIHIMYEERGELTQAALDHVYPKANHHGKDTIDRMKKEAIQTAAMAIRFLENIHIYNDPGGRVSDES
jgi:hypothetical protein